MLPRIHFTAIFFLRNLKEICTMVDRNTNLHVDGGEVEPVNQNERRWIHYVPNTLTVIRLLLIPVFLYAFDRPNLWLPDRLLAMAIFLFATLTDYLDGTIARKYNAITNFGRLADPAADKLIVLSAIFCLFSIGRIPLWFLLFMVGKELLMLIGSFVMLRSKVVVYSKWYGKAAMFTMSSGLLLTFWEVTHPWNIYLLYLSLALSLYSFIHYLRLALKQLNELKEHPDNPRDIYKEED
jgi:CDP-diacylglycerol--glycerol-3-phosphate 3-phosphatidyltransferase